MDNLRERALQILAKRKSQRPGFKGQSHGNLVYELEVHQTELEMQNEAYRQTVADLEKSNKRYYDLYQLAPVAYFTLSAKGIITNLNERAAQLTESRESSLGKPISRFLSREDADKIHLLLQKARESDEQTKCEVKLVTTRGEVMDVWFEVAPFQTDVGEAGFRAAVIDLTENKKSDRLQRLLSGIVDAAEEGIVSVDQECRITAWNSGCARMLDYASEEAVGRSIASLVPDPFAHRRDDILSAVSTGGRLNNFEIVLEGKSKRRIDASLNISPIQGEHGKPVGSAILIRDVTERKQLESEVLSIAEREQRRMGQDLHDSLGQHLLGIRYLVELLASKLEGQNPAEAADARQVHKLIEEASNQCRQISRGYALSILEVKGLGGALQHLAGELEHYFHVQCLCHFDRHFPLSNADIATHLYRIAQEATTNAVRHGQAQKIEIGLSHESQVVLTIQDDGVGLPQPNGPQEGMGLKVMRYRAEMLHGSFAIHSTPGRGTTVTCTIPLPLEVDPPD